MEQFKKDTIETEIDIRELFLAIKAKILVIILVTLISGVGGFLFFKMFVTPMYQSSSRVMVMNKQQDGSTTISDVSISTQLTQDYMYLITGRAVLDQVIAELELDMSADQLKNSISVTTLTGTRILQISVTNQEAILARDIANAVAEASVSNIKDVMEMDIVNFYEKAIVQNSPVSPNTTRNAVIAAILGFIISCGIVVVLDILDDTIKNNDDIENYLGISVLGMIPIIESETTKEVATKKRLKAKNDSKKPLKVGGQNA